MSVIHNRRDVRDTSLVHDAHNRMRHCVAAVSAGADTAAGAWIQAVMLRACAAMLCIIHRASQGMCVA
jgi:hypothetical protein